MRAISPSSDISEALALFTLAVTEDGTSRPSWIARQVGMTSGGTTKVINRLESSGYIQRSFGLPGDRRGVAVTLTNAGFELLDQMTLEIDPHARQLLPLFVDIADHLQADSS